MIQKRIVTMSAAMMITAGVTSAMSEGPETGLNLASGPAYSYNEAESTLYWEGSKPGGRHFGTIEVINGNAQTDGDRITGGTFEIDMTSIRNEDIENEGMRNRLLNHLRSEDFFHVEKFPTSTFEITGVEPSGDDPSGYLIYGDLTIRGNTREVSFPAEITMTERAIHARSGEIRLNRTDWEVNYKSRSIFAGLKDSFINDEMIVRLDVHLNRN